MLLSSPTPAHPYTSPDPSVEDHTVIHTVVPNNGMEVVVVVILIEARVKVTKIQGKKKKPSNCPPASLADCPSTFWLVRRGIFLLSPKVTC